MEISPFHFDFSPPIPLVRALMREYAAQLGIDLCFQNFEAELAELPGRYAAPEGCLVVAYRDDEATGCAAFRPLSSGVCEMKRLYVRPAYRGQALGRKLAELLMARARDAGYRAMRLDTLSTMKPAIALYESLGFTPIAPYNNTPVDGCLFFEANLREALSLSAPAHAKCKAYAETDTLPSGPKTPLH